MAYFQCDQIGLFLKGISDLFFLQKESKYLTIFWAIWKNVTFEVKTTLTTLWATFRKLFDFILYQHLGPIQ